MYPSVRVLEHFFPNAFTISLPSSFLLQADYGPILKDVQSFLLLQAQLPFFYLSCKMRDGCWPSKKQQKKLSLAASLKLSNSPWKLLSLLKAAFPLQSSFPVCFWASSLGEPKVPPSTTSYTNSTSMSIC